MADETPIGDVAQQKPSAPAQSVPWIKVVGAIVVVIILAAAYLTVFKSSSGANSAQNTTSVPATSSIVVTTNATGSLQNVSSGGGPGQSFISSDEASSLMGSNGTYSAEYNPKPSPEQAILTNNVTGIWSVAYIVHGYIINGAPTVQELAESVYKTPEGKPIYKALENQLISSSDKDPYDTIGAINATTNGLTYSFIRYSLANASFQGTELIGYKNSELVAVITPYNLNQTDLASVIAGDMP